MPSTPLLWRTRIEPDCVDRPVRRERDGGHGPGGFARILIQFQRGVERRAVPCADGEHDVVVVRSPGDGHGAVVSEFPIDTAPDKQTFPMRNRIISGWSFGTLVVEAPARSGALITVNQALEQGRNIYAVPGPIDRDTSLGANKLIQQGAKLVLDAGDILEDIDTLFPAEARAIDSAKPRPQTALNADEETVYNAIDSGETQIETIILQSGLSPSAVSSTLVRLEMKRLVKQLPGNYFVKLV